MLRNAAKAPTACDGGALGNVVHCQAINTRVVSAKIVEVQANYLRRRFRLTPATAGLIAEIYFGRAAA